MRYFKPRLYSIEARFGVEVIVVLYVGKKRVRIKWRGESLKIGEYPAYISREYYEKEILARYEEISRAEAMALLL